jgi:hypothetical protein
MDSHGRWKDPCHQTIPHATTDTIPVEYRTVLASRQAGGTPLMEQPTWCVYTRSPGSRPMVRGSHAVSNPRVCTLTGRKGVTQVTARGSELHRVCLGGDALFASHCIVLVQVRHAPPGGMYTHTLSCRRPPSRRVSSHQLRASGPEEQPTNRVTRLISQLISRVGGYIDREIAN